MFPHKFGLKSPISVGLLSVASSICQLFSQTINCLIYTIRDNCEKLHWKVRVQRGIFGCLLLSKIQRRFNLCWYKIEKSSKLSHLRSKFVSPLIDFNQWSLKFFFICIITDREAFCCSFFFFVILKTFPCKHSFGLCLITD